jgi:hypothetical protein
MHRSAALPCAASRPGEPASDGGPRYDRFKTQSPAYVVGAMFWLKQKRFVGS